MLINAANVKTELRSAVHHCPSLSLLGRRRVAVLIVRVESAFVRCFVWMMLQFTAICDACDVSYGLVVVRTRSKPNL